MTKKIKSFRLSYEDDLLIDKLVKRLSINYNLNLNRTDIITKAIRKLASEHFTEEELEEFNKKG
ncbi:hypothetical protein [Sporosarcina jiandibaonis]|uniref:hypothetical protein n=1 Tax=Sporosarcina jiandibaonis TaxID=2715535 RepID=UPI001556EF71|nr:hypothetical protein [Sporosarcina jiandibaonis]